MLILVVGFVFVFEGIKDVLVFVVIMCFVGGVLVFMVFDIYLVKKKIVGS